ncbi:MAG: DNA-binding domain-containing protein [Pseudomonadota bacterium]|nr:DNA-binding domain-containing protein [Pseudomonadota bacterium]
MTQDLARFQSAFAEALFASASDATRLPLELASQPAFAVYRNTVMKACIDALEANFPSVARLVGGEWFRAAAAIYLARHPPQDPRLLRYGEGFAEFLETFEPADELPYLPGVASLDRCWTQVHAAQDAAVDLSFLAALPPEALASTRIAPHPAARWMWFDDMPVFSIWSRNRPGETDGNDDAEIDWQGEGALLTRRDDAVVWQGASRADCAFLECCGTGALLGDAATAALEVDAGADLANLLARLLRAGALIAAPAIEWKTR